MSRPASCRAVEGLRPSTGVVVLFWKYRGTISTSAPKHTTISVSTIIRVLLVSIFSCEKSAGLWLLSAMLFSLCGSGVGRLGDRRVDGATCQDGHHGVPQHQDHAAQVEQATRDADHVEGIGRLHAFDEAVDQG